MPALELKLTMPSDLADKAESAGLLTSEAIINLIQEEIQRQQLVNQLFNAAGRLAALDLPPLTDAEIELEIQASRHARRS
ncbi:MAG TPA: hypothetical protein ENK32_03375 [Anaerolineae bacterium]|nr:hypothetical protein [Anaerolineae bacterium]